MRGTRPVAAGAIAEARGKRQARNNSKKAWSLGRMGQAAAEQVEMSVAILQKDETPSLTCSRLCPCTIAIPGQRLLQELCKGRFIVDLAFVIFAHDVDLAVRQRLENDVKRQLLCAERGGLEPAVDAGIGLLADRVAT